jgi:hypothetical protein
VELAVVIGRLVWGVAAAAIAFGLNHQLRPHFEPGYERSETTEALGHLALGSLEIPSRGAHVVVADVSQLGRIFPVREVSLRSVASGTSLPSFELFAELPGTVSAVPGAAQSPRVLRSVELRVRESGRLGARPSFLKRTAADAGKVLAGTLLFTDVRLAPLQHGAAEVFVGDARLELQVETERGVELITGRWTGQLAWH